MVLGNRRKLLALILEGSVALVISYLMGVLFNMTFKFCVGFCGSIAFTQLIPSVIRLGNGNKRGFSRGRIDNMMRIFLVSICCLLVMVYNESVYPLIWCMINVYVAYFCGRYLRENDLTLAIFSYYARMLNFSYLLLYQNADGVWRRINLFNGFFINSSPGNPLLG